jgi:hypothetical protein
MYDDGQHNDGASGDGTYGATIPAQPGATRVEWFILTSTTADIVTFEPMGGEEDPNSYLVAPSVESNGLVVNEFVAKNNTGVTDEAGQYEDWIEIYNGTGGTYDLSGGYLSDDVDNLTKWQIPASTQLADGETLLVWADDDELDGPMHASFKLNADGEEILLVDADGLTLRDHIVFGAQESDISTGRLFDGDDQLVTFSAPTPEASNEQSCGYRSYDQLDSSAHGLLLEGSGTPSIGASVDLTVSGSAAGDSVVLYASSEPAYLDSLISGGVVLINPSRLVQNKTVTADGSGIASLSVPLNNSSLAGRAFYLQAHLPSSALGVQVSNALELIVCP